MMAITIFDTLAYAKKLIDVGVSPKQAEVQAEVLADIVESKLSVQQDLSESNRTLHEEIREIKKDLKHGLEHLETSLRREICLKNAEVKADIIKWIVGICAAQTTVIFSVIASVFKLFH